MKSKIVVLLLLLFIFGVPALVTAGLLFAGPRVVASVPDGKQPGGEFEGRVVDGEGDPIAGMKVRVFLRDEAGAMDEIDALTTDGDGKFQGTVPEHEGHYLVDAGGVGTWQGTGHAFSFLDREGNPHELRPIELELRAGAHLVLELVDGSGDPMGDGELRMEGRFSSPYLFGLVDGSLSSSQSIRAGRIEMEGLPAPMETKIHITLDSGESAELELQVQPGRQVERIEF